MASIPAATISSGGGGSDHASFLAAGVPGLNWTLKGRSDYFFHTWHSQWDTIDVAIPEYQRHTSTVIALAALGTANLPELLDRSGVSRRGGGRSGCSSVRKRRKRRVGYQWQRHQRQRERQARRRRR